MEIISSWFVTVINENLRAKLIFRHNEKIKSKNKLTSLGFNKKFVKFKLNHSQNISSNKINTLTSVSVIMKLAWKVSIEKTIYNNGGGYEGAEF